MPVIKSGNLLSSFHSALESNENIRHKGKSRVVLTAAKKMIPNSFVVKQLDRMFSGATNSKAVEDNRQKMMKGLVDNRQQQMALAEAKRLEQALVCVRPIITDGAPPPPPPPLPCDELLTAVSRVNAEKRKNVFLAGESSSQPAPVKEKSKEKKDAFIAKIGQLMVSGIDAGSLEVRINKLIKTGRDLTK